MKITELRIGNLIGFISIDNITQVQYISDGSYSDGEMVGHSQGAERSIKDFVGIPITEEWLVKFGFEHGAAWTNYSYMKLVEFEFSVDKDPDDDHLQIMDLNFKGSSISNIKYVHQLQNIYFALIGHELLITEKAPN